MGVVCYGVNIFLQKEVWNSIALCLLPETVGDFFMIRFGASMPVKRQDRKQFASASSSDGEIGSATGVVSDAFDLILGISIFASGELSGGTKFISRPSDVFLTEISNFFGTSSCFAICVVSSFKGL